MTQEVGSLIEQCEENSSIRAEFELAKKVIFNSHSKRIFFLIVSLILKMIINLQDKLKAQQIKFEEQIEEVKEQKKLEIDISQAIRKDLESKEKIIVNFQNSLKV